jgi:hypothetical protein
LPPARVVVAVGLFTPPALCGRIEATTIDKRWLTLRAARPSLARVSGHKLRLGPLNEARFQPQMNTETADKQKDQHPICLVGLRRRFAG